MKKVLIYVGVIAAILLAAVGGYLYFIKQEEEKVATDMKAPSLPWLSFTVNDQQINELTGYIEQMDAATMRDTITPVLNETLEVQVHDLEKNEKITSLNYDIYSLDGKEKLQSKKIKKVSERMSLEIPSDILGGEEKLLMLTLSYEDKKEVHYYTRVAAAEAFHLEKCLPFVQEFLTKEMDKEQSDDLKRLIEPSADADNGTYQTVTLYSDLEHVSWGELQPKIIGDVHWDILETNKNYTSVRLNYQVEAKGMENTEEVGLYNIEEFFRVRFSSNNQMYLLDYNRTMNQVFQPSKTVLDEDGILLGMADSDVEYMANEEGDKISFVQERELWTYDKEKNKIYKVFSFNEGGDYDVRNNADAHDIHITSIDEKGNLSFIVVGYMNRGTHEGDTGMAVYYFNIEEMLVEEKAFIPGTSSFEVTEQDVGQMAYYSEKSNLLYIMQDGTLYEVDMEEDTREKLVQNLKDGQFIVSQDGHLLAYQKGGDINDAKKIEILNLSTGKRREVTAGENEAIKPLGFIRNDFVYGISRTEDAGTTSAGETVVPMYQLQIVNEKNRVVKQYQMEHIYILDVLMDGDMMTLNRVVKNGSIYTSTSQDYITNNEERKETKITIENYKTTNGERQVKIKLKDGIEKLTAKLEEPHLMLSNQQMNLSFDTGSQDGYYYVYALGGLEGIYSKAAYAVNRAAALSGVAVSGDQQYIFESGNKETTYLYEKAQPFQVQSGESALRASLRMINELEQGQCDVAAELDAGKTPMQVLEQCTGSEALDLTGCTVENVLYLIGTGTPVIAMTGGEQCVLLVGYDTSTVTYLDPASGTMKTASYETMNEMTASSGHAFIGYIGA